MPCHWSYLQLIRVCVQYTRTICITERLFCSIYKTYFRPNAKGPEIVKVSHYFICFWAVWMGEYMVVYRCNHALLTLDTLFVQVLGQWSYVPTISHWCDCRRCLSSVAQQSWSRSWMGIGFSSHLQVMYFWSLPSLVVLCPVCRLWILATITFDESFYRGVVLSPAVIPIALTVSWSKLTKPAVILGPLLGAILGMTAWMVGCWKIFGALTSSISIKPFERCSFVSGTINVANLAEPYSAVCSGLTGLLFSGIITVGLSLWSWFFLLNCLECVWRIRPADPDNYDFKGTRAIANLDTQEEVQPNTVRRSISYEEEAKEGGDSEVQSASDRDAVLLANGDVVDISVLKASFKRALWYSLVLAVIVTIIGEHISHLLCLSDRVSIWKSPTSDVLLPLCVQWIFLYLLGISEHVSVNEHLDRICLMTPHFQYMGSSKWYFLSPSSYLGIKGGDIHYHRWLL